MTTTPTTPDVPDQPCRPDWVYLGGACRCYTSALATAEPDWMTALDPPF